MPITARTMSWPERARPKAATAASSGISMVEKGPAILCQRLALSASVARLAAARAAIERCSRKKSCSSGTTRARGNSSGRMSAPSRTARSGRTVPASTENRLASRRIQPPPGAAAPVRAVRMRTRCGRTWGLTANREGQTFEGESLFVRYVNFVKLPHTVFALPFALLGVVLASYRYPVTWRIGVLVVVAFTAARFVAMGFNRIADRRIDARNPRRRGRELPAGRLTVSQAWAAVLAAMVVFLYCAWALNPFCAALAPDKTD